jgi:hypothetical protein
VAVMAMLSATEQARSFSKQALGVLSDYIHRQRHLGGVGDGGDSGSRDLQLSLASMRESCSLLEQGLLMRDGDAAVSQMIGRIQELQRIVEQYDEEREEVAKRFTVLHRALDAAKEAEREKRDTAASTEELLMLQMQNQHQADTIRSQQDELVSVNRELRELRKLHEDEVARLKDRLLRATANESATSAATEVESFIRRVVEPPSTTTAPPLRSESPSAASHHPQVSLTKIRALDMTVAALNAEVACLEDKVVALQRKADDEAAEHSKQIAALVKQHHSELEECDVVVEKMAAELEALIHENTTLRQRQQRPASRQ